MEPVGHPPSGVGHKRASQDNDGSNSNKRTQQTSTSQQPRGSQQPTRGPFYDDTPFFVLVELLEFLNATKGV
jgi:hypothetical protein